MMQVKKPLLGLWICFGLILASMVSMVSTADAQTQREEIDYSLSIGGIRIGSVKLSGVMTSKAYNVRGSMGGAGIGRAFVPATYSGSVTGFVRRGGLRPHEFSGRFERGRKYFTVDISYQSGRPKTVTVFPEPAKRAYDLNIRKIRNALDPMSMAFDMLRRTNKAGVCNRKQDVYEGRRLSRLVFGKPVEDEKTGNISCEGSYTRVDGYPPDLMKKQTTFKFNMTYDEVAEGVYQVKSFETDTTFGVARGKRRNKR